ncbi:MAG: glycine zipper 2TM domain-containing protein [Telluria sp.]
MNAQAKLIVAALGVCALPLAQAQVAEFEDYGNVTRVQPRVERFSQPRQECRTEYVQVPVAQQQQRSAGGAILGALAGGVIGNQVGGGSGRAAATAAGVLAGAAIGDRVGNDNRAAPPPGYQEQAVRQCRTVDSVESRTMGYDVTYDYRGRTYTTLMQRDPGNRVRLRVSVEPDER